MTRNAYLERLKELVGPNALAIVSYGSCLSSVTQSKDSTPDFFVIVESYGDFYAGWRHRMLNRLLPPNIYHFHVHDSHSKYSVVSLARLKREVEHPRDMYILGRFSKKMELSWTRDPSFEDDFIRIQELAVQTASKKAFCLLPPRFSLDEFIHKALALSYIGDVRVESNDKVKKIFDADQNHYREHYARALSRLPCQRDETSNSYVSTRATWKRLLCKLGVDAFLFISRIRAQLRWPKAMFTASNWLDYVIQKIERTQNIKINLTPDQKKLWFIYGWKYFFILKKKRLIK